MTAAKEISAALLAGEKVGFYSEFPWEGELPDGLILCDKNGKTTNGYELDETEKSVKDRTENSICESEKGDSKAENQAEKDETMDVRSKEVIPELGIAVTIHRGSQPFTSTVTIIPPVLSLGIGCKKGSEAGAVLAAAEQTLITNDFYREAFADLASIDLKKDEEGIKALAQAWKLPFTTYTADELQKVPGEFTPSAFVQNVTGVDNVCERSAVRAAGNGRLLQKKHGGNGVTTAVAAREWRIHFE